MTRSQADLTSSTVRCKGQNPNYRYKDETSRRQNQGSEKKDNHYDSKMDGATGTISKLVIIGSSTGSTTAADLVVFGSKMASMGNFNTSTLTIFETSPAKTSTYTSDTTPSGGGSDIYLATFSDQLVYASAIQIGGDQIDRAGNLVNSGGSLYLTGATSGNLFIGSASDYKEGIEDRKAHVPNFPERGFVDRANRLALNLLLRHLDCSQVVRRDLQKRSSFQVRGRGEQQSPHIRIRVCDLHELPEFVYVPRCANKSSHQQMSVVLGSWVRRRQSSVRGIGRR